MSELPEGWGCCKVRDLFKSFSGGTPSRENAEYWNGNIPWLSSGDIKSDRIGAASELITESGLNHSSAKLCRPGSVVVVVRSGILKHTLPVAILEKEAAINQDIKCFDSGDDSLNQWLAFSLKALSKEILSLNREGTTVQSVEYETLKELELRVPPLSEQRRIVAKLKPLLDSVDAYKQRLVKIPVILKRFRQAVLAAACSGRLTANWRESNSHSGGPNEIIYEEKAQELFPIEIPVSWHLAPLSMVAEIRGGIQKTPQRKPVANAYPYLRVANVYRGALKLEEVEHFELFEGELERWRLEKGDILIVEGNGSIKEIGRCAIWNGEIKDCVHQNHIIRCRPSPEVKSEFLLTFLNSDYGIDEMANLASSTSGLHTLSVSKVGRILIPVAPLAEQQEIVRHVEALFKLADQIEARYQRVKPMVDKLPQSILAKAFRGELVPTEAELARREGRDYEPASVLLERIRSERAEHANGRKEKARSQPSRGRLAHGAKPRV